MSSSRSMSSVVEPGRIELARLRRGLTQRALADQLGVTPRTVSRYEKDGAPLDIAPSLAAVLDFPALYFSKPLAVDEVEGRVEFRAARSSTKREQAAAKASRVHGGEIDDWVIENLGVPGLELPDLEGASPVEAANEIRYSWALKPGPLPNLIQLFESKGVHVYGIPSLGKRVDAFSTWYRDRPLVYLGFQKTPERSRFDAAHELGHLLMHRNASTFTDVEKEKQADEFASEFLIPRSAILGTLPYNPSVNGLLKFRSVFKVSAMEVAKSTYSAGLLSDWNYRQTVMSLSKRGFRSSEPGGMVQQERSRIFGHLFDRSRTTRMTVNRLAELLHLPADDVHGLTLRTEIRAVGGNAAQSSASQPSGEPGHLRLVQ